MKKFNTRPVTIRIKKIIKETDTVNTYIFDYPLLAKPGQFVLLWIPGVDEKPLSVAYDDGREFWLTVCNVGLATDALFKMKEGDYVGVRGPFGTCYKIDEGDHLALVAGGYGVAPMYFVAAEAMKKNCKVEFLIGARSKDLVLYESKISALNGVNLHVSTNDGSMGFNGLVTNLLENVILEVEKKGEKIDKVFTCGPEMMMKFVGDIAWKGGIDCYVSVEKYMKCGVGVCGQCAVDSTGVLACKQGPVMKYNYVRKLSEFGKYHRDAQGKKVYFKN